MRVLVTGAGGTIGGRLAELLARAHDVTAVVRLVPPEVPFHRQAKFSIAIESPRRSSEK